MSNIISFKDVSLNFGGVKALSNVSFDIKEGSLQAIIGPNGAGKTSIFNCISGIYNLLKAMLSLKVRISMDFDLTKLQIWELQEHFKISNYLKT